MTKKSCILTVSVPHELMEIIKKEAEKRKIGYSTYIRIVLAESLLKGEKHDQGVWVSRFLKEKVERGER